MDSAFTEVFSVMIKLLEILPESIVLYRCSVDWFRWKGVFVISFGRNFRLPGSVALSLWLGVGCILLIPFSSFLPFLDAGGLLL